MIYLDNAATTQIAPDVLKEMMPYLREQYGNAGTVYRLGRDSKNAVCKARQHIANFIAANPDQIIFTSGGSEANSFVFHGIRDHLIRQKKKKIIVSTAEHDSVLRAVKALGSCSDDEMCIKHVFDIVYLNVSRDGVISVEELKSLLTPDVGLVSVMYVNNETGSINPVNEIGNLCKQNNILFHTDCVQAAGCHKINVDEIGCDFLSISSHKIHGAKGVGAIYARNPNLLTPIIYGGSSQEFGLRGGTENVAGIVAFGKACELMSDNIDYVNTVTYYKQEFFKRLLSGLKEQGLAHIVRINGGSIDQNGKTLNLGFKGIDGETLVLMLDSFGVCISAGSACRSRESEPSHVLIAMGLSPEEARCSVRISFSEFNEIDEIQNAADIFVKCIVILNSQKGG